MDKNSSIGVFDSGVGGLTSVKELKSLMPNENIVYLGDTARLPYGTRGNDTIHKYALEDVAFLKEYDVKMIIVACGTVSSVMMTKPIFSNDDLSTGVLFPAVRKACSLTENKRIGVIGTSATIKTGGYGKAIREIIPDAKIIGKACPLFVPLVENGYTDINNKVANLVVEEYLEVMKQREVDTLIMGCTHYPLLAPIFKKYLGDKINLVSPGAEAAKYARDTLSEKGLLSDRLEDGETQFFCTDSEELFKENVHIFLGENLDKNVHECKLK